MVCGPIRRDGHRLISRAAHFVVAAALAAPRFAQYPATIARVKPSIVSVGTLEPTRNPQFSFAGTGFAVRDGSLIATNEHVVPEVLKVDRNETIAVAERLPGDAVRVTPAKVVAADPSSDLVLLKVSGIRFRRWNSATRTTSARASFIFSPGFRSGLCLPSSRSPTER